MPPVRGRQRTAVAAVLVGAGTASAALAAVVVWLLVTLGSSAVSSAVSSEVPWRSAMPGTTALVGIALGVAVLLDLAVLVSGRPTPPRLQRQVPRAWGRLLPPTVVAALYGARLGVGPLTMLSTWLWWAVTVVSALLGLGPAVAVGATFGAVRLVVTAGASMVAGRSPGIVGFDALRRRGGPVRAGLVATAAVVVLISAAGCSAVGGDSGAAAGTGDRAGDAGGRIGAERGTAAGLDVEPPLTEGAAGEAQPGADVTDEPTLLPRADGGPADRSSTDPGAPGGRPVDGPVQSALIEPATLEDVVRSTNQPPTSRVAVAEAIPADPAALSSALVPELPGFRAIDEPGADRFLDLTDASQLQPDPTEEVALLETRGYRGGWTRAFRSLGNDVAVVSVYHFADAAEAEFYLEDGLITIGGYGGSFFDLPGMPGVRGFTQSLEDDGEELRALGAAFQAGPRWYLVYLVGSLDTVTPEVLVPAVAEQRELALAAG